jgi:hypothetical protein
MWDKVKSWFAANATQYTDAWIPPPGSLADAPLVPMKSYFRIWIAQMFVRDKRILFTNFCPAVNGRVKLTIASHDDVVLTRLAAPQDDQRARGVLKNFAITDLLPYSGGIVEVDATLLALPANDFARTAISVVSDFSSLVGPPISQALGLAKMVVGAVDRVIDATAGGVRMTAHQSFVSAGGGGANLLRPGYFAVVLADKTKFDPTLLRVNDDELYHGTTPVLDFDHMLLRIEGRDERDDYRFKDLEDLIHAAIEAYLGGDTARGNNLRGAALVKVATSADLAVHDRHRVAQAVMDEIEPYRDQTRGAVGLEAAIDLTRSVKRGALTAAAAKNLGDFSLQHMPE